LNGSTACFTRTIFQAISKVGIGTKAFSIGVGAAKFSCLSKHVVDTHLTACWQTLSCCKGNKGGDDDELHSEGDWE